MGIIDSYKKEDKRLTKEYYKEESIHTCIKKGWDQSKWEQVANLFTELQIEKDQIPSLCKVLEYDLIMEMHEALF